jgi:hypothetical protein
MGTIFSRYEDILRSHARPSFEDVHAHLMSIPKMFSIHTLASFAAILGVTRATYGSPANPAVECAALASSLHIPNVTVNFATFVPANTNLTLTQGMNKTLQEGTVRMLTR